MNKYLDIAPEDDYFGEIDFRMQYKSIKGDSFDWLLSLIHI